MIANTAASVVPNFTTEEDNFRHEAYVKFIIPRNSANYAKAFETFNRAACFSNRIFMHTLPILSQKHTQT
jgi:hypothetical protein